LVRQDDDAWRFSRSTVAEVGRLAARLKPLERKVDAGETALALPEWLAPLLPIGLLDEFVGLAYWQWLGLILMLFVGLLADLLARTLLRPLVRRVPRRLGTQLRDDEIDSALRMLGLTATGLTWVTLLPSLVIGGTLEQVLLAAGRAFTVLAGTFAGFRLADVAAAVAMHRAEQSETKFDDILVPLVRKTVKIFIFALGIVYGAQSLYINIVPLITGLGIGGLAFAFAAKDTIENFFGSVAVILDRPFEVGDWVVIGDVEGTVEELGFRSTRVRTFYNSQVTIPNAVLVRATVDNLGRRTYRRWKSTLGLQYDTPPEKLLAFSEGVRELVRRHPFTRKDFFQVWCNDFGASSLNILLYVFFETPDWSTELRERERLMVDIVRLADRIGVSFAFPTQTVHLYREEHGPHTTRYAVPRDAHDVAAAAAGARAARELTESQAWRRERPGSDDFGSPVLADDPVDRGGDG
jgi:MscS family membrane protein